MKIEGKGKRNKIEAEEMALESKSNPIEEHQDEGDDVEDEIHHNDDELARNLPHRPIMRSHHNPTALVFSLLINLEKQVIKI